MGIGDFDYLNLRNTEPIQAAVRRSGRFFMVRHQDEAVRMFDIHGELLVAISAQLVEPGLRQLGELFKIRRVRDVLESSRDPPSVVLPAGPKQLAFGIQHFRELAVLERKLHRSSRMSNIIHPKGE